MAQFVWIDWNLAKLDLHSLSAREVEHAWHNRRDVDRWDEPEPGIASFGTLPNGQMVKLIWRYNGLGDDEMIFIITAYKVPKKVPKHRTNRA
jgi:hypothetical protein